MKIYFLSYVDEECGRLECFASKQKAKKRKSEIDSDGTIDQYPDEISEVEFPITAKGLIEAMKYASKVVTK